MTLGCSGIGSVSRDPRSFACRSRSFSLAVGHSGPHQRDHHASTTMSSGEAGGAAAGAVAAPAVVPAIAAAPSSGPPARKKSVLLPNTSLPTAFSLPSFLPLKESQW